MPELLTACQAYEKMGMTQEGVDQLVAEARIAPTAIGNNVYYDHQRLLYLKNVEAILMRNTRMVPEYGY